MMEKEVWRMKGTAQHPTNKAEAVLLWLGCQEPHHLKTLLLMKVAGGILKRTGQYTRYAKRGCKADRMLLQNADDLKQTKKVTQELFKANV